MKKSLTITTAAKNTIQKLHDLVKKDNNTNIKHLFDELNSEMKKIDEKFSCLLEENSEQKNEIQKLMKQIAGEYGFEIKNNVYYTTNGDGPFCPFCSEKRGKRIRLRRVDSDDSAAVCHSCRVCENEFKG